MFKSIIIVISLGGQFRYLKLKYFQEKKNKNHLIIFFQ